MGVLPLSAAARARQACRRPGRSKRVTAQCYGVTDCKPVYIPMEPGLHLTPATTADAQYPFRQLLGSLLWFCRCTRPEIAFSLAYLSPFSNSSFSQEHFGALKRVLKYLYTTHPRSPPDLLPTGALRQRAPCTSVVRRRLCIVQEHASLRQRPPHNNQQLPCRLGIPKRQQHTVALSSSESEYMAHDGCHY